MSLSSRRLRNDRDKLINAFAQAAESAAPTTGRTLIICLLIALIGTMVPLQAANVFFSIASILISSAMLLLRRRLIFPKKLIAAGACLAVISVATGCSPAFLEKLSADIIASCNSSTGEACKVGVSKGWAIAGIPIRYATIDQARLDGDVQKVFGVETVKSAGLISVTRLTVYGS